MEILKNFDVETECKALCRKTGSLRPYDTVCHLLEMESRKRNKKEIPAALKEKGENI